MTESVVRLSFPAKPDYLVLARLALSGTLRHLGLDDEEVGDLKLAVTEACGNVVKHAYDDGPGPVDVAFLLHPDRLVVIVEDQGAGIGRAPAHPEPPEGPLESGMGMAIISAIVDEHDVGPGADGRGTVVRMTKYLAGAPA